METSGGNPDAYWTGGSTRSYSSQFSASSFFQAPLTALLEYSGFLRPRSSNHTEAASLLAGEATGVRAEHGSVQAEGSLNSSSGGDGEVLIRIIPSGDHESQAHAPTGENGVAAEVIPRVSGGGGVGDDGGREYGVREVGGSPASQMPSVASGNMQSSDDDANLGGDANNRESSYQRYDIQQLARWVEQILPFSLLLLVVFIRQHLQGFFVTIWIAAVMFKSNDILRKQTALKAERKMSVLVGITVVFMLHVFGVYWWYRKDDLLNPLVLLPPKEIPPFWHAIFFILVNDTMVRQAAMVIKCILLIYYRNSRGRSYRKQLNHRGL